MSSPAEGRKSLSLDIGLLRHLFGASPGHLPKIYVHDNAVWLGPGGCLASAKIDNRGNLHMAEADMLVLKTMLPVRQVRRVRRDVIEFAFDIQPHNLEAGYRDKKPVSGLEAIKAGLRAGLGHDAYARRRKIRIAGKDY